MTSPRGENSQLPALEVEFALLERFEHAGLTVELHVATNDLGPRAEDVAHEEMIVFAHPYEELSDRRDGSAVLSDLHP